MPTFVINPKNGNKVKTTSKLGKQILKARLEKKRERDRKYRR